MKEAHLFLISFFTAHFRRHDTKKFRSTYLLPPPTVIWGMIGAIMGIERGQLMKFVREYDLAVGAELCSFKGVATEKATLMMWDESNKMFGRTIENFEFLIEPQYKIGVYAKSELIEELKERIEKMNFKYDVYGGISDCFLKEIKNEGNAKFEEKGNASGMVPVDISEISKIEEGGKVIKVLYLNAFFYQGFKVEFKVKKPIKTVNGIAIWDKNDIKKFRRESTE